MSKFIKNCILNIFCILLLTSCSGQTVKESFDIFLSRFTEFNYPVNPVDFIAYRKGLIQTWGISKDNYNNYLNTPSDSFWQFNNDYSYTYGGKHKQNNYWIVFYSRHFMPENIEKQKGEFVLVTYTLKGSVISSYPIAGGYGDTLTFSATIFSPQKIEVNYIETSKNVNRAYTRYYGINDEGEIYPDSP